MNFIVQLARRVSPLLVLALAAGACDRADPTEPIASTDPVAAQTAAAKTLSFASAFRGGIPFGTFHLPQEHYGSTYNGSMGNIYPKYLLGYLQNAKRSGTKLILTFSSSENNYRTAADEFSLSMWKKQVDRFRGVDFTSYIADGTIVGHYLIDEPHDPANWNGKTIPLKTLDEMAKYSKDLWPTLPTVVRAWPAYLKGHDYKYLDAAWAQYSDRFGSVSDFMRNNVRDAKASGLKLVVGLNQLAGGSRKGLSGFYDGKFAMGASELETWGNALLADPYPCAFISWKYDAKYMGRSDVKEAMARLAAKARNHEASSCSARGAVEPEPKPEPEPAPVPEPQPQPEPEPEPPAPAPPPVTPPAPPVVTPPAPPVTPPAPPVTPPAPPVASPPAPSAIQLNVSGRAETKLHRLTVTWSGLNGRMVDVYRNGARIKTTENDKRYVNLRYFTGAPKTSTYVYKLCESGTSRCSNEVSLTVR